MSIPLLPARLPQKLAVAVALCALLGLLTAVHDAGLFALPLGGVLSNLFNLNKEGTVPAWFSSVLLLLVAYHGYLVSQLQTAHVQRFRRLWQLFAVLFLLLSLDEAATLHEKLQSVMVRHDSALTKVMTFAWVVPALLGCAVLALAFLRFVLALDPAVRWRLIAAGALYVFGAAGMEVIGGAVYSRLGEGLPYLLLTVVEEVLEMSGALLCLSTLYGVLQTSAAGLVAEPLPVPPRGEARATPVA